MIPCEKCGTPVDASRLNTFTFQACPGCGTESRTDVFKAAVRQDELQGKQQAIVLSDDAGCFYHPAKKAVTSCRSCGRFLCALCDIDMNGRHICFSCMEAGMEKETARNMETYRFLPDGLAIRLSTLPLLSVIFSFFTCVTAPFCIYYIIRHWNAESGITPRRKKLRFVLAFLFSAAQTAVWVGIIVMSMSG